MQPAGRRLAVTTLWLVMGWAFTMPACSRCLGSVSSGRECDASGGATLATAPGLTASKPLYVSSGMSCFDGQGCTTGMSFYVFDIAPHSNAAPLFDLMASAPPTVGDFTVSPPPVSADWNTSGLPSGTLDPLTVTSGSFAVQGGSATGFSATFAVELRTKGGDALSVTDGHANVSNCRIVETCGE